MKHLKKFEHVRSYYDEMKNELEETCLQYLTNITDNNYEISFKDLEYNYFELIIKSPIGSDSFIDFDLIKDDLLNLIEYLLKSINLKFDTMEIRSKFGFISYLYSNKMDRILSGEEIRNVMHINDDILEIDIVFRIER